MSDSSARASIPAGVQDRMGISLSVGRAMGTQTFVFSYDAYPRIFRVVTMCCSVL